MLIGSKHKELIVREKKGSEKGNYLNTKSCVWTLLDVCYKSMASFRFAMVIFNFTFYKGNANSSININQQNFMPANYMAYINIFLIKELFL